MNRRHSIVLAAAASCAATLLVGGITWAAIPGDGGVINACYGKIGGVVRVIDTAKREKCNTALEVPLSWNQQGQKGDPGTPGAPGTNGVDGKSPTVTQLAAGDPNCPAGGAAIKDAAGTTAYVCSGRNGEDGESGENGENGEPFSGTFTSPNGNYSITVSDDGILLVSGTTPVINITGQDIAIRSDRDATVQIGRNLTTSILGNAVSSTGGASNTTIGTSATLQVSNNLSTSVGGTVTTEIGAGSNTTIGGSEAKQVGAGSSTSIGSSMVLDISGNALIHSDQDFDLDSSSDLRILSGSSTRVQSSGEITIQGSKINMN